MVTTRDENLTPKKERATKTSKVIPKVVSIDIGYGHVKVVCGENSVLFPTEIGIYSSKGRLGDLITSTHEDNLNSMIVQNEGVIYAVGKSASHADTVLKRIKDDNVRFEADEFRILIAVAIHLTSGGGDVYISTGLPIGYHQKQKDKFREYLLSEDLDLNIEWLSGVAMETDGEGNVEQPFEKINIVGASVYPQGLSAVYPALMDGNGISTEYTEDIEEGSYIALVDIGMRTLDSAVVEMDGDALNYTTVGRYTYMDDTLGYSRFLEIFLTEAESKIDTAIPPSALERVVANVKKKGYFKTQKGKYELKEEYEESRRTVANMIYSSLTKKWGSEMELFNVIFVLGGGGTFFFDDLKELFANKGINIVLVDNAQFANTNGYNIFGNVAVNQLLNS
ncbi:ParM/StbA family protein [Lysinibacillus sp. 1P01SD]|uniref:ParM/StbA family protein n=1 Tax=Lysinibacillus sp. 1P01SD TaxID=3132285 RepID=UPI0039A2AA4F